ncbi:hypothetical protein OIO90_003159 [Microbotryomycetes sp. JL221]|nr:hypothetical protein OIO90_003159 [Microbotryomycetes sp. JL221]
MLGAPLPSHPGLHSRRPSTKHDNQKCNNDDVEQGLPTVPPGALAALSLLINGAASSSAMTRPSAQQLDRKTGTSSQSVDGTRHSSLLSRRNGSVTSFHLGSFASLWPSARSPPRQSVTRSQPQRGALSSRRDLARKHDSIDADLPPSPVGLPGAWIYGSSDTSGALLLPPPFLDDRSTKESFQGVLGTRFARETSARARREARDYARDRPPPPTFPASLLVTASKIVSALGPPGGVDSGPMYRRWRQDPENSMTATVLQSQRQVDRAEKGMRSLEVSERFARKLADKLRVERRATLAVDNGHPKVSIVPEAGPGIVLARPPRLKTATPATLLSSLSSPSPASPPLFSFPTPGLEETPPTSVSTGAEDSTFAPPKPCLRPLLDIGEPSPLPSPMLLQVVDSPKLGPRQTNREVAGSEDGGDYFTLRQRTRSQRRTTKPVTSLEHGKEHTIRQEAQTNSPGSNETGKQTGTLSHVTTQLSRRSSRSSAFRKVQSQVREHLDLILWILVGQPNVEPSSIDQSIASIGGVLGFVVHLIGFSGFVVVHVWALIIATLLTLRSIAFFMHWTFLNVTGQTDLSIVIKDYYRLCRKEWDMVSEQDGSKLSVLSVMLGLFELMAVQAMSKERWLQEGPGQLVLLNGDHALDGSDNTEPGTVPRPAQMSPEVQATKTGTFRTRTTAERPRPPRRATRSNFSLEDVNADGGSLLVTGGGDSILEGKILNDPFDRLTFSPRAFSPRQTSSRTFGIDEDDDLPPLSLDGTLPGFSLPPSPNSLGSYDMSSSPPLRPIFDGIDLKQEFFTLLKRHVRLATASYGLHSYILAPPSPLFTPSVNQHTLPHKVFSHLSGVDRKTSTVLHVAIQKHYTGVPEAGSKGSQDLYEPQFYLLRDDMHGEVICVVRGTQSLADIRTDLEAGFEPVSLSPLDPSSPTNEVYLTHSGILAAARRLLDPNSSPLFHKLKATLEETGYSLVFDGHSLGASISSMLAILIGQYNFDTNQKANDYDTIDPDKGYWTTMGIPQVRELRRALGRLARNRRKWVEKIQRDAEDRKNNKVESTTGGPKHGKSEILKIRKIEERAWRWRREVDGDIDENAGKHDPAALMAIPAGKCFHIDRLPRGLEHKRKRQQEAEIARKQVQREQSANVEEEDDEEDEPALYGIYSVGRPSEFYSLPWLEADLVKTHLPREYLDCLSTL